MARRRCRQVCFALQRFASRVMSLASGLALAVKARWVGRSSRIDGAPQARPSRVRTRSTVRLEGPTRTSATFRPAPGRFRPALGAPGVKMTVWSCLCRAASGVEARTDAAGPGNGARQSPRPVGLPPEGPSEAAAPQRRDPNDASRLLRIPAALLRPRPFALARVAGPGRKAWRAEGAPLKPWRSCNNPAHGAGSFPVPVSVGV